MAPNLDPSSQQFLYLLNRIQTRMNTAQMQMSSGLRVNTAADAPDEISSLLQLHADIAQNQEIQTTLGRVKNEVDTGEQAVSSAVDLVQQASVLATQATGPLQTATTRATMAQQVQGIMEQMVSLSRTTVDGRYIFGGDLDQSPSYQIDLNAPTGVDRLQNATDTRQVLAPDGSTFPVSLSANQIFDVRDIMDQPASGNVFAALNGLRVALLANDTTGINTSISQLQAASTYINDQLALYGQTQNRVAASLSDAQNADVRLRAELSSKQDADVAAASLEMTQSQTQLQASLTSRAKMPNTSLFELL